MFAEVTQHEWTWPEAFEMVGCAASFSAAFIVFIWRMTKD